MDSTSFYTSAGNFISAVQGSVDPRTGLFNINLPLANLQSNQLMGPGLSLSLMYSPLSAVDKGFGRGFRLNLSQYNMDTGQLTLSSGEEYRVSGSGYVEQQKLKNFIFEKITSDRYRIIYKSGLVEHLSWQKGNVYLPAQISLADGRSLTLVWGSQYPTARLERITDDSGRILCRINYPDHDYASTRFELLPDKGENSHMMTFIFNNDLLIKLTSRTGDEKKDLAWNFRYEDIGPGQRYRAITGVTTPTGLEETVNYYTDEGMLFPEIAGLPALPCVYRHTLAPGGGQPKKISTWTYTRQNYLGKDAPINTWQPDQDHMLNILLADYHYGSIQKNCDEHNEVLSEVTRQYNSYHLLVSEKTRREGKIYTNETLYHAEPGKKFDDQPEQYALPQKQTECWEDEENALSRTQVILWEFDEHGNPLRQETPDGTVTRYSYYPAEGEGEHCPADPYGFTRYLKTQTVTPPKKSGDEPVSTIVSTWQKLGCLSGDGYYVVSKTARATTGKKQTSVHYSYHMNRSDTVSYGRISRQEVVLTPDTALAQYYGNSVSLTYQASGDTITEGHVFVGYDGQKVTGKRVFHTATGLVLSQTSPQEIETHYTYDARGRSTARTICPGSVYENTTTWQYSLDEGVNTSIETDASGNKDKIIYDGAGRVIRQHQFDAGSSTWNEVFSCNHNALGEIKSGSIGDWLPDYSARGVPFTLKSDIICDGWGEKKTAAFSDGRKKQRHNDPINLKEMIYDQGTLAEQALTSGSLTTTLDKTSLHPLSALRKDENGKDYSIRHYHWDGLGRLLAEEDENNAITTRTYDELGRMLTQTLPDGTIVSRTYAPHLTGNQIASIHVTGPDAQNKIQTWLLGTQTFDSLGRITSRTSGNRTTTYCYDGASPVPATVTLPSGKMIKYTYIPAMDNAISSMTADGITQTYRYDEKTGDMLAASEADCETALVWSQEGHITEEVFSRNNQKRHARYSYTLNGTPVSYTDVTGAQIRYRMNEHGRIISIMDDNLSVALTYDALGRISTQTISPKAARPALAIRVDYDAFDREVRREIREDAKTMLVLSRTWHKNDLLATQIVQKEGVTVREERYTYDKRNRLVSYTASGSSLPADAYGHQITAQSYCYDALNNLTCVKTTLSDQTSDTATFVYHNAGDPTQLTAITHTHRAYPASINLQYDADGRLSVDEAGRRLEYDAIGRLVRVKTSDERSATYSYDAMSRLISQNITNKDERQLYYRASELVSEITVSGQRATRLIKNGHTTLGVSDNGTLTCAAGDENNSVIWSRSSDEKAGREHVWSPYGSGDTQSAALPGFNGEKADPFTGVYHLGNGYRAYNPVLMRFNCPDSLSPFGAGGINPYAYCAGDPINHTDPSGHLSWQAITGIVFSAVSLGLVALSAGTSIAAAGSVLAALGSATAETLIMGSVNIAGDVAAIVSASIQDKSSKEAEILGYISLGLRAANVTNSVRKGLTSAFKKKPESELPGAKSAPNSKPGSPLSLRGPMRKVDIVNKDLKTVNESAEESNVTTAIVHPEPSTSRAAINIREQPGTSRQMDVDDVADMLKNHYELEGDHSLRAITCYAGKSGSMSLSARLSRAVNQPVKKYENESLGSFDPDNIASVFADARQHNLYEDLQDHYATCMNVNSTNRNRFRFYDPSR